ncbi:Small cellulose binding protein [Phytophthora megakarya]|uniref:Small cellulose binding protein n=1 Tax=Phytophthora megakarya TaxID=4795 RepID=A0A225UYC3_9STRA|nr:Small cellulose binding protein [Phytophthora megakarya]
MTYQGFVAILFTLILVIGTVPAANLRNAPGSKPIQSASDSFDNVTQDSTASLSSDAQSGASGSEHKLQNIVQTQETSAPAAESGGVKAWAQCGGLYYLGETKCQQHTFCKQLSEFISVCFPESRPTEKVIRLEL